MTSFLIAVVLHAIVFVVVQWVLPVEEEEEELDYTGPIYVTIEKYKPEIVQSQATPEPAETESAAATSIETDEARRIVEPSPRTPPVTRKPRPETPATAPVERPEESFLPETAEQTEESFPEGVRRIIIPAEEETLPAGLEVPRLEQKNEPAAVPPEFLSKDEEEKPLYFDLSKLDNALVTEGKPGEKGETGRVVDETSSISSEEGASGGTPIITWDEGGDRTLLSPITDPEIPDWVEQEGLRLQTLVVFEVTPEGHTTSLKVERSSGYADVDASVLETVRKLKFNPVTEERIVRGRIDYIITPK